MRKIRTILLLVFTLHGLATPARAADEGGQAAACTHDGGPSGREKISFTAGLAWNNSSSITANLHCSTVRLTQGSPRSINIDYFDGSTTDDVVCSVAAFDFNGGQISWFENHNSSIAGTGGNFFTFTAPISVLGYIDVRCNLPANGGTSSGIIGFNVQ